MWKFFLSFFNLAAGFAFRSVIVKFGLFFGLFFVTTEFIVVLVGSGMLPTAASLNSAWGGVPASVWYFLDLFNISAGISTMISAYTVRFIIRRIPIIG